MYYAIDLGLDQKVTKGRIAKETLPLARSTRRATDPVSLVDDYGYASQLARFWTTIRTGRPVPATGRVARHKPRVARHDPRCTPRAARCTPQAAVHATRRA